MMTNCTSVRSNTFWIGNKTVGSPPSHVLVLQDRTGRYAIIGRQHAFKYIPPSRTSVIMTAFIVPSTTVPKEMLIRHSLLQKIRTGQQKIIANLLKYFACWSRPITDLGFNSEKKHTPKFTMIAIACYFLYKTKDTRIDIIIARTASWANYCLYIFRVCTLY